MSLKKRPVDECQIHAYAEVTQDSTLWDDSIECLPHCDFPDITALFSRSPFLSPGTKKSKVLSSYLCYTFPAFHIQAGLVAGETKKSNSALSHTLGPLFLRSARFPSFRVLATCSAFSTTVSTTGLPEDSHVLLCHLMLIFLIPSAAAQSFRVLRMVHLVQDLESSSKERQSRVYYALSRALEEF